MADKIPEVNPIQNLQSILELYGGKTSTQTATETPTSTTTKSNLTPDQLTALINEAMAPLSQASHGAGLSPYSDTNLSLGRAKVAGEILAKNAGTTTTASGGTRTTTNVTPAAMSPGNLATAGGNLLLQQIGGPLVKKVLAKTGVDTLGDKIGDWFGSLGESSPVDMTGFTTGAAAEPAGYALTQAAPSIQNLLSDSLVNSSIGDIASSVASDVGTSMLTDTATSSAADTSYEFFKNLLGFKDGGMVKASPKKYADGGNVFVDRNIPTSTGFQEYKQKPTIDSLLLGGGGIAPTPIIPTGATNTISAVSDGGGGNDAGRDNPTGISGDPDAAKDFLSSAALTGLGILGGPLGSIAAAVIGKATGTQSLQGMAFDSLKDALGIGAMSKAVEASSNEDLAPTTNPTLGVQVDIANQTADPLGSLLGLTDAFGTAQPGGVSSSGGGMTGADAVGSGSGYMAHGGGVSGPGTGTSDSIDAKLSNGETVVTAKTTQKVKQLLGDDFFFNLERMFNADAARNQLAQGRA